jgi:hypothetical protein
MKTVAGGHADQVTFETDNAIHQTGKALRCRDKIQHRTLEATQQAVNGKAAQVEAGQAITVATARLELRGGTT